MSRPVIFLAFSDDPDQHLALLQEESRNIERKLHPLQDAGMIELYLKAGASVDDIFYSFNRSGDRIAILHYGGHASGTHLRLDDQEADAAGLARLIGTQPDLKLVFLNGCSTRQQVGTLLLAGVKAVIATSIPVNDRMATDFAGQFYGAMAQHDTLGTAFEKAAAFLQTKYGADKSASVHRSLEWEGKEDENTEMPWGLYLGPDAEDVLEWKLPDYPVEVSGPAYQPNQKLTGVLETMASFSNMVKRDMTDEDDFPIDPREYPDLIIKHFPWPIGAQIRTLFANVESMRKAGKARLAQMVESYVSAARFLCFTLISQYWDEVHAGKANSNTQLKSLFLLSQDAFGNADYMAMSEQVFLALQTSGANLFVEEAEDAFKRFLERADFFLSYRFLESMRRMLQEDISEHEAATQCPACEAQLSVFLNNIAFLADYRLLTIKDIDVAKYKHMVVHFSHKLAKLHASDEDFLKDRKRPQELDFYTDTKSILLVKSAHQMELSLNLSPLIIDKHAFEDKDEPRIYVYAWNEGDLAVFQSVKINLTQNSRNPLDWIRIEGEAFEMLREQLALMKQELLG